VRISRERKYLLTGWLWFLVSLVPVIGIVQVGRQAWADRYAYLPLIGLFTMATWLGADLLGRVRVSRTVTATGVVAALFALGSTSYLQISYWRNGYTLFKHALEVTRENAIAEDNFGQALVAMGQPELAVAHFRAAIRIAPKLSTAHYNLGTYMLIGGNLEEAKRQFELSLAYASDPTEIAVAHNNLATSLMQLGNLPEAKFQFDAALRLRPKEPKSLIGRATVEYQQGNLEPALADFTRALEIQPSPGSYYWQGRTLEQMGKLGEARSAYQAALRLAPNFMDADKRLQALVSHRR
jgi:tetratricopeptide (TPR) repeat protein